MGDPAEEIVKAHGAGAPARSLLDGMRSGTWLEAQHFPELRYAVPAIVPEGLTVLAGAPKTGKSWAALHIALAVSSGTRVFGCLDLDEVRPTLYLALEDGPRRLQSRARSLLVPGARFPAEFEFLTEIELNLGLETVAEWLERSGHRRPVVIVDTLAKIMPRAHAGESAYERDYRGLGRFKQLVDSYPGTSLVLVHHTRKMGAEDFVDGVSGTAGITGSADTTVVLARSRNDDDGVLKVTGRDVWEAEYAVRKKDGGLWVLIGGSLEEAQKAAAMAKVKDGVGDRSAEIIDLVSSSDGIGPKDIAQKLSLPQDQVGMYLKRLTETQRITRVKRGVYSGPETNGLTQVTPPYLVPVPDDPDG